MTRGHAFYHEIAEQVLLHLRAEIKPVLLITEVDEGHGLIGIIKVCALIRRQSHLIVGELSEYLPWCGPMINGIKLILCLLALDIPDHILVPSCNVNLAFRWIGEVFGIIWQISALERVSHNDRLTFRLDRIGLDQLMYSRCLNGHLHLLR